MIQLPMLALLGGVGYLAYEVNKKNKESIPAIPAPAQPQPAALPAYYPDEVMTSDPNYAPTVSDSTGAGGGGGGGGGYQDSGTYSSPAGSAYSTPAAVAVNPSTNVTPVTPSATPVATSTTTPASTATTQVTPSLGGGLTNPFKNIYNAITGTGTSSTTNTTSTPVNTKTPPKSISSNTVFVQPVSSVPITTTILSPKTIDNKPLSSVAPSAIYTGGFSSAPAAPAPPKPAPAPVTATRPTASSAKGRFAGERNLMMADVELGEEGESYFADLLPTFVTPEDAKNYIVEVDASWSRLAADIDGANLQDNVKASWTTDLSAWQKFRDDNMANVGWLNTKATMEETDRWLAKINQWNTYVTTLGAKISGPAPLAPGQGDPAQDKLSGLKMAGIGAAAAVGAIAIAKILTPKI